MKSAFLVAFLALALAFLLAIPHQSSVEVRSRPMIQSLPKKASKAKRPPSRPIGAKEDLLLGAPAPGIERETLEQDMASYGDDDLNPTDTDAGAGATGRVKTPFE